MRRAAAVGFLSAVVSSFVAHGPAFGATPSFDCGRAATSIERLICSSESLSNLDFTLGTAFRESRERQDQAARASSLLEQRRWLQSRLTGCNIPVQGEIPADRREAAEHCLSDLYAARIAALKPDSRPAAATSASISPAAPVPSAGSRAPTGVAVGPGAAKFDRTLFAAQGDNQTLVTIGGFGRYSVMVKSDQGTALQLVDRMAGPSPVDGSAGHGDGRIDALLDRGQYKIRLFSDARGSGDAELSVVPSVERNPDPQQLLELKPVVAELGDHEQRSYWLDLKERRFVVLEAAGRYLADLRLWKDGNWLVDATPNAGERDPNGGEPLAIRQLALWLEPGLYRLIAYGGVGEKWSSGATGKPFYLSYGIPKLPEAGRAVHDASPTGVDRWIVPGSATYFRVDTDVAEHTTLSVATYDPERPFATGGDRAAIEKDSRDPKAEVRTYRASPKSDWLVTVERKPGARYRLQYFDDRRERPLDVDGPSADYWLATLQGGNGADSLDPTAIVVQGNRSVVAASAVELDPAKLWRRKFNLLGPVSIFVHAGQPFEIATEGSGADAEYRLEPFMVSWPADYRTPPTKISGGVWSLDRGYSVLTIYPREGGKGILTLTLRPKAVTGDQSEPPRLAAPVFPKVNFKRDQRYALYLGATGDDYGGAALHQLPLDLGAGVSFQLAGGATLAIPVMAPGDGRIEARTEDGKPLPVTLDGQSPAAAPMVASGRHDLALTAPVGDPVYVAVTFTPKALLDSEPLPPVDSAAVALRPNFPVLTPDKPAFLDLARDQQATFAVTVDKPALYRLESSGIIETAGAIRTRTVPSLDEEVSNGVGRNFLIQQYLREGDYQLSAHAAGRSFGPIGLAVTAAQVADLGALEPELWARATLSPGQAGRYRFHIADAAEYRLYTLGLHHDFAMRLDDGEGWPLLKPGVVADATIHLAAGDYQIVLLPRPVESRAVTLLHRIQQPRDLSGHGPFALTLGEVARNRWMEPDKGAARVPDRWTFSLPASAEVTVTIDNGMQATLVQGGKPLDDVALAERPWVGPLPAGDYTVEAVSAAPNSRVDYSLQVATTELLVGQKRSVVAPARLPVSIGAERQVEFASFGGEDVMARLYDSDGKLVAANDDRESDWNFLIPARLRPGRYELRVDPVGGESLSTEVALAQPDETQDAPLAFGATETVGDGRIHIVPLADARSDSLIVINARAGVPVGLSIEGMGSDGAWQTLGSTSGRDPFLALPRGADAKKALRARIWSVDHGHIPIQFSVTATTLTAATESSLTGRGLALTPLDGVDTGLAVAAVTLDEPGVLQLGPGGDTVLWATVGDTVAARDASGSIVAPATKLWLIDKIDPKNRHGVSARRIDPYGAEPVHLVARGREAITLPLPVTGKDAGIALWRIDGQGGQPGVSIGELGAPPTGRPPLMAIGPDSPTLGSAVAIAPGPLSRPAVRIWNAGAPGEEMPVTLRRIPLGAPKPQSAAPGITDGQFAGKEAQSVALPVGFKRLTLVLPADTTAVPMKGDAPERMIWSVSPRAEIVETSADHLLLLHAVAEPAPYSITVEPVDAKAPVLLSAGAIVSRYSPTPGILHLGIEPGQAGNAVLRIAGSAKSASVVAPDGSVRRGGQIAAPPGSLVNVEYRPGLFAVGLDPLPQAVSKAPSTTITPPAIVPLSGASMNLKVAGGRARRLVHVASDIPIVLSVRSGGNESGRTLFGTGADLNFVLAQDQPGDIEIDPAGVPALSGSVRFAAIDVMPIGEGLGPKRRLAPGQSRAFSFTLPETRTVGVGVRASVDVASSRLLGADGAEIGEGLVHMHTLKAGTYVLVVDAPSDGPAIDVQPALVGSVLPDKGPPDSVKADYLALVGKQAKN